MRNTTGNEPVCVHPVSAKTWKFPSNEGIELSFSELFGWNSISYVLTRGSPFLVFV